MRYHHFYLSHSKTVLNIIFKYKSLFDDFYSAALVQILTEPKNALVKQYQYLFDMEGVQLTFEPEALTAIAKRAQERKTGARGLRSIIENALMDTMYELPSMTDIAEVIVTKGVIESGKPPVTKPKS
ncbi:hypothetical protein A4U55_00610 [Moraxella catarrhalis]|nr:hypothetical protein A4U55_00610 [Moraxella catarrhalis]